MRKGEPMGVCKALTITKILFWSGMGLMLLSPAIMSIADDAGAWTQGLAFLGLLVCFGGIGFGFCKVRCPYCGKSLSWPEGGSLTASPISVRSAVRIRGILIEFLPKSCKAYWHYMD